MTATEQRVLDDANARFWTELCGSALAQRLGIVDSSAASLERFDRAYFAQYPYLDAYYAREALAGRRVLEIGLGYGSLGARLARAGARYSGIDISPGPVAMMRHRLQLQGATEADVGVGSALDVPFPANTFDYVYSIGCLHHTGDLPLAVREVHRVLRVGGKAVVMLYYRHSLRRMLQVPLEYARRRVSRAYPLTYEEHVRAMYDVDACGSPAPHVELVSRRDARRLFAEFSRVKLDVQNFFYRLPLGLPREPFLATVARVVGQDLYITAVK